MLQKGIFCDNQKFKHLRNFKELDASDFSKVHLQSKEFSSTFQNLPEVKNIRINASFFALSLP